MKKNNQTPAIYGKNSQVSKLKNKLEKLEENSGNMTIKAYNAKLGEFANEIHKSLQKANDSQMEYIISQVSRRQDHGYEYLKGNEKKLNIDKVLKLNVNLSQEQIALIDKAVANRKDLAKNNNSIKKSAATLLGSKHSELLDIPKLRYTKGDKLKMITESEADIKMIQKLASGKALLAIAG